LRSPQVQIDEISYETFDPIKDEANKPLAGAVIGLDPGHQARGNYSHERVSPNSNETKPKVSSGTRGVSSRVPEYIVVLDVALLLKQKLEELGAEVVMVRETHDVNISNIERAILMNGRGADLVVRIHCNGSDNRSHSGAMMFVPQRDIFPGVVERSYNAGQIIFKSFLEATDARNAGFIRKSDLTGFNWSEVPVILIEMGFMTNPREDLLLVSPEYQLKCAEGLSNGIAEWWRLESIGRISD
jgi:N-acetylmuramoyl-L-alanine amidase